MSSPMISEDKLSLLPSELIHHILSFLPDSYEAARTAVLSSRFRHIWAHHPSIRLVLVRSDEYTWYPSVAERRHRSHVGRCLSSHNLSLLTSLDLTLVSCRSAHRWIHKVSIRSPSLSFLRISSIYGYDVSFPRLIFACRNLVSLVIESIPIPYLPSSFPGFLSLTNLNLYRCRINGQTLTSLLSKCPNLTTLSLTRFDILTSLHISSTKLTHLNIDECDLETLSIEAPNITSISYVGIIQNLYLENACQLRDANISQCFGYCPNQSELARVAVDLRHVSNKLQVDDWFFEYLLPDTVPKPLFNNLKVLHCCVEWISPPLLDGLVSILDHCSNLEQLIIDMSSERQDWHPKQVEQYLEEEKERQVWDSPQKETKYDSHPDFARNLKNVTVKCFIGTPNEMKILEYLIGKASGLESLIIGDCMSRSLKEIRLLFAHIPGASSPHL